MLYWCLPKEKAFMQKWDEIMRSYQKQRLAAVNLQQGNSTSERQPDDEDESGTEAQSGSSVIENASGTAVPTPRPIIPMPTVSVSRCEGLEGELETSRDTNNPNPTHYMETESNSEENLYPEAIPPTPPITPIPTSFATNITNPLRICENPASISPQFTSTPSLGDAVSGRDDVTPIPTSSSTPASISPQITSTPSCGGAVSGRVSAVSGRGGAVSGRGGAVSGLGGRAK
ncbi:Uncharacterized protein APZ42_025126 [Daphnia magna]|uniref:Uncharacterized protein n=1 Tax=Daphnia magna TaxID=35525 RepID=A0A164TFK8_9CRUS|nr:Uncharacterized protein APZ42_025126 [Daphnia magna]